MPSQRRIHGQTGRHLQQVVLDDVPYGARLVVEAPPPLDANALGHGDLHAVDVVAVPDRLEQRVAEAEIEQVLHRLLAEVVIDTEDVHLGKYGKERPVERLRGGQVTTERLLRHDAATSGAAGATELLDHGRRQTRRNGEVVQGPLRRAQLATQEIERRRVLVVAVHIAEQGRKLVEGGAVDAAVLLQAVLGSCFQLVEVPACFGHADDRHVQMTALHHRLERRKDLLVRKVSGRAEEDQRIGRDWIDHYLPCWW